VSSDGETDTVTVEERSSEFDILTTVAPTRWAPSVFGVVPAGARRRRPSDVVRAGLAALIVALTALGADDVTTLEMRVFDVLADLPSWIHSSAEVGYRVGVVGTLAVLGLAFLATRKFRLVLLITLAGFLGWAASVGLRALVDASEARRGADFVIDGAVPEYPAVVVALATTALLVAAPYLLRPARRIVVALLTIGATCAVVALIGLPDDVVGGVAIGWGVAAVFHLIAGTPAATPSTMQVARALEGLGVAVSDLELADRQVWGETRFTARAKDGASVAVDVIGRDATDARLFAKLWRLVWYKDSGPTITLTRTQQLEHRAYILLSAARAGVPVSDVVIAGVGGPERTALLVLRDPDGVPLTEVPPEQIPDAVLDDAWNELEVLHRARIAHGESRAANLRVRPDGTVAFVDFALGSAGAPAERCALDSVALLTTTAAHVGSDRALAAAERALGPDGLAELLPMLEPAALSAATRHDLDDAAELTKELRELGAARTGTENVAPVQLRRVSVTDLLLAAGTILGVYLLIGQLAGIDFSTVFDDAEWGWVAVALLISPLPQFTGAIAMLGSVSVDLPYKPVLGEQFANNFTGLVGGTVATTALVIRFFQKQGQKVAIAASSGILNSFAAAIVQTVVVIVGLIVTGSNFTAADTGGRDIAGLVIVIIVVIGVAVAIALVVPSLRRRLRGVVAPQWNAAKANVREIVTTPRKAAMLFGGNLMSQTLFALVLSASLHAYGDSLQLLQLMLINSLASVLGGMAPVPGGMGVIEAGLIGGLTAAGVPQDVAVAATFTHRLFTAYLPPIWGWFALQWLRRNDYI
jgi:uncharacterized membrane protein YbhN (UPF0104 family)/tRNA A-37 threonylcarbamoyl transferase component Bud32